MHGVLVVDKPQGLTSHDVVAAARRLAGERQIGHTGTLDPLATGVLPLAIGRATRLVRFLSASDKEYDATIRFGLTTDSYDITGAETSRTDRVPPEEALGRALRSLTGEYRQAPPAFSAKKIGGRRAYQLARESGREATRQPALAGRSAPRTVPAVELAPAPVRVDRIELLEFADGRARVAITCSAGFYVRSFAHALGEILGTGACLEALRRTRAGEFTLDRAIRLEEMQDPARIAAAVVPLEALLRAWPAVRLTARGRERVGHGRELEPDDYAAAGAPVPGDAWIRVFDGDGTLVALATPGRQAGSLHPAIVLI